MTTHGGIMTNKCVRFSIVLITATTLLMILWQSSKVLVWTTDNFTINMNQKVVIQSPRMPQAREQHDEPRPAVSGPVHVPNTVKPVRVPDIPIPCDPSQTHLLKALNIQPAFKQWPPSWLTKYKNPCWVSGGDSTKVSCLPYFHLAGVSYSGTTDLYDQLVKHPDIVAPDRREGKYFHQPNTSYTLDTYLKESFTQATAVIKRDTDAAGYHRRVTFDANPNVFTSYLQTWPWPRGKYQQPNCTLVHAVHAINPATKIIVILRDPLERFLTQCQHMIASTDPSMAELHRTMKEAKTVMNYYHFVQTPRCSAYDQRINTRLDKLKVPLHSSLYSSYAAEWLNVFPKEQLHFIKAEEFYTDSIKVMKDVFSFLGLDPAPESVIHSIQTDMEVAHKHKLDSQSKTSALRNTILAETRTVLTDLYESEKEILAEVIGPDKWLFNQK